MDTNITSTSTLYPWQRPLLDQLLDVKARGYLSHAVLLYGNANSGLENFARLYASRLLCEQAAQNEPCGSCRACVLMAAGSHPEFQDVTYELNEKTSKMREVLVVEQIRRATDKIQKTRFVGSCRVVVIHPVEDMMPAAANALLKILEEPPENTYFILLSYAPSRVLATIRSRCQLIDMPLPDAAAAEQWLAPHIADATQRQYLLALSGNNPLLVQHWQEQGVMAAVLQLGNELKQLREGSLSPVALAAVWLKTSVVDRISWWWRWLALELKATVDSGALPSWKISSQQRILFMQKLLLAKQQLESSSNPNEQLLLESLLIDWQQLK